MAMEFTCIAKSTTTKNTFNRKIQCDPFCGSQLKTSPTIRLFALADYSFDTKEQMNQFMIQRDVWRFITFDVLCCRCSFIDCLTLLAVTCDELPFEMQNDIAIKLRHSIGTQYE